MKEAFGAAPVEDPLAAIAYIASESRLADVICEVDGLAISDPLPTFTIDTSKAGKIYIECFSIRADG